MRDTQAAEFHVDDTALGAAEAEQLIRDVEADVVLNGITGSIGLEPTLAALAAGHLLALANKESLIVGGELVKRAAAPGQLIPVDSEHSALAQALRSGTAAEVDRLIVTAMPASKTVASTVLMSARCGARSWAWVWQGDARSSGKRRAGSGD